jgi:hypothetical protein
MKPKMLELPKV